MKFIVFTGKFFELLHHHAKPCTYAIAKRLRGNHPLNRAAARERSEHPRDAGARLSKAPPDRHNRERSEHPTFREAAAGSKHLH